MCREQISDLRICKGIQISIMNDPSFIIPYIHGDIKGVSDLSQSKRSRLLDIDMIGELMYDISNKKKHTEISYAPERDVHHEKQKARQ